MSLDVERPAPATILVVDDEEVLRTLCSHALAEYRTLTAGDGDEALLLLEREPVDLILTDVMMSGVDGLELLRRSKEQTPNRPVIVMTGYADKEIILQALKANADDFITKPINLLQLRTTVQKALERQHLREELVELKRMDRLKSDFLGLVSHKLKTPSTAVSLFLQNLAEETVDLSDPGCREALNLAREELRQFDHLIRDLLYYSNVILQDGPPRFEAVELGELVLKVLSAVAPEAEHRGVEIQVAAFGPLPSMQLDRKRIMFVLNALVENAVKFSPKGSSVNLGVKNSNGQVQIQVEDYGIGIPPEELPKVFERFYQVDPAHSGQVRGFGLGLYYARQFVQAHGGSIHLDSRPGAGTTATVLLPVG